jgi:hypothetical protein
MKRPLYTAAELIERLQEAHAKLGNHPNVLVEFDPFCEEITTRTPSGALPRICIPTDAIQHPHE